MYDELIDYIDQQLVNKNLWSMDRHNDFWRVIAFGKWFDRPTLREALKAAVEYHKESVR